MLNAVTRVKERKYISRPRTASITQEFNKTTFNVSFFPCGKCGKNLKIVPCSHAGVKVIKLHHMTKFFRKSKDKHSEGDLIKNNKNKNVSVKQNSYVFC